MGLTPLGNYWISYTTVLREEVNLRPLRVVADPPAFSNGEPVTVTLRLQVSNSGNIAASRPFTVTLYDDTDHQIGSFLVSNLEGCGGVFEELIVWPGVAPGAHRIRVQVDSTDEIAETREDDNEVFATLLVATSRIYLPLVLKQ